MSSINTGKILIVEDDINVRENILDLLDAENFHAVAAQNGCIGLELANKEIPDLIICDVMMPELDGYGVLNALRRNPVTATIPFVFLTAKSDRLDFREGMRLGADDYLTKPFTKDELLETIKCRLEKQFIINQNSQHELRELRRSIAFSLPHEIRTPLSGILGFSQLLMKKHETIEKQEIYHMAENIKKSANRLFDFTQKFLLYAQLESIATDSEKIKFIQSDISYFIVDSFTLLIKERATNLRRETDVKISFDSQCKVKIATNRLYSIIEELIDNCLKFSEPNTSIFVSSFVKNNYLILSFTNYGRGMSASEIHNVGAYKQFNRHIYEQQGSGLGLIIVKRLAQLHKGSLEIQSTPGDKTIVQVKLPCL
ncbi:MAG: response regulator [Rivularia sp. (in: cyanobacteria)]